MKVIIIEGPDNTGKNTLINNILETNNIVKYIHCSTPKSTTDPFTEQKQNFIKLSNIAITEYRNCNCDVIVFNRFYQGEYVYGQIYRNTSRDKIKDFINQLEKIWQANVSSEDLYYVQLLSSSTKLLKGNDDGKSLSEADEEKIAKENKLFAQVFNLSIIKKKHIIYINEGDSFKSREDILTEFNNFINS